MYLHGVNFAQWNTRVTTGLARQLTSYARDRSTVGLFGLAPDRIDWENRVVYENKGTGGAVDAVSEQSAFYALMLSIASGQIWKAATHILSTRRRREVVLDQVRLDSLWQSAERLEVLAALSRPPVVRRIPLCASCSFAAFCGHD